MFVIMREGRESSGLI